MKTDLSLRVLWSIANAEASLAGAEKISPDFFWLGALKLFDKNLPFVIKDLGVESDDTAQLVRAVNSIKQYLEISEKLAKQLRRRLRKQLRNNLLSTPSEGDIVVLHRSPESKEVFYIAGKIAKRNGAQTVSAFHIVRALFDADYVTINDMRSVDESTTNF